MITIEQAKNLKVGDIVASKVDGQELLGEVIVVGINKIFIAWEDDFTGEIDLAEVNFANWVLESMEII